MNAHTPKPQNSLTGNAGLFHEAHQLSRHGWQVTLTVRNARGADLYIASENEQVIHAIQSKALSKIMPVPLGASLAALRSPWGIITTDALSDSPSCYLLTLDEVKSAASEYAKAGGGKSYWLRPQAYVLPQYHEAWHRLSEPRLSDFGKAIP